MIRKLYTILASISVSLGVLGIFLPILPTTPFLLLAIFLYMRSSKSGVKRILRNKYLSPYVYSYFSKKGIPTNILIRTIAMLWVTLAIAISLSGGNLHLNIFLIVIGVLVSAHLYMKRA